MKSRKILQKLIFPQFTTDINNRVDFWDYLPPAPDNAEIRPSRFLPANDLWKCVSVHVCVCACVCVCTYIDFFIIFESWTFQFFLFWVFDFSILWCHDSFICVPWVWARPSKLLQENDLFVCIWKWQGSLFWVFCIFQKKNSDITHFCTWPSYWYWTVQTFVSTPVWVHTYSTQTS